MQLEIISHLAYFFSSFFELFFEYPIPGHYGEFSQWNINSMWRSMKEKTPTDLGQIPPLFLTSTLNQARDFISHTFSFLMTKDK
jgi:hypothetical protein